MMCIYFAIGITLVIILIWKIIYDRAPKAYEDDEGGWHYGDPPEDDK